MIHKVMKTCGRCHGAGQLIIGGHQNDCPECEGKGFTLVDRKTYYKQLRLEQSRKEKT